MKKQIKNSFCIFLILTSINVFSQRKIFVIIFNTESNPIISASIILKDNTGKFITYTYTDELGKYELKTEKNVVRLYCHSYDFS